MKDCNHHKYQLFDLKKEFKGHIFEYKAETCLSCNAILWSNRTDIKYNKWLQQLYTNDPHLFTISINIDFILKNLFDHLAYDFNLTKEELIIELFDFCNEYSVSLSEHLDSDKDQIKDIEYQFKFNPEQHKAITSLAKLCKSDIQILLTKLCELSKRLVSDRLLFEHLKHHLGLMVKK